MVMALKLTQSEFRVFLIGFIEYWGRFNSPAAKTYRMIGEAVLIGVYGELLDYSSKEVLKNYITGMEYTEKNVLSYLNAGINLWENSNRMYNGLEAKDKSDAFRAIKGALSDEI